MIKLDDIPISKWGLKVQNEHDHPAIPEIKSNTMTIPNMDGEWDFGSQLGTRNFSFPLGFIEYDKAQKQRRIREFVAFLFDQKSKPREIKLSFDYEPEKYYYVKVSNGFSPQRIIGFAFFNLEFIAFDPYIYAEQTYKDTGIITGIQYDSGYSYDSDYYYENPTSFQWVYSSHYSGVYSYSFMEIPFIVEINGTVMNPTITNQTTGETIHLPTITNQKLTLDCKKFTVKVNDINKLSQYNGDFINLVSGDNSLLFTGGSPNATVAYKWKHKFI